MSLSDLQRAEYKSPTGQVVKFDYTDIETSVDTKAAVFESASGNGTYVQSNGHTSGRFPMNAYFHGADYDNEAEAFLSALLESGEGVLTHPIFGEIKVVPTGEIRRVDALVTAADQIVYSVSFFETTGLQIGEEEDIQSIFDALMDASALDFADKMQLDLPLDQATFKNKLSGAISKIENALGKASAAVASVTETIEDVGDSINRGIDVLIGDPLTIARQTQLMISEPRRQLDSVKAKLDGYKNLANDIVSGPTTSKNSYSNDAANAFHFDRMTMHSFVGNDAMLSAASPDNLKKADYIASAESLITQLELYQTWHDDNYAELVDDEISNAGVDTGGGVLELRQLISRACSSLITKAFEGKTEFSMVNHNERTPIDLCYELYGTATNEAVDLFTGSNKLVGEELFLIPVGREIVWYL